jgi:hypothetical protein
MNEQNTPAGNTGETAPPFIPGASAGNAALGAIPGEQIPIGNAAAAIEAILRQPRRVMYQLTAPSAGGLAAALLGIALVCSIIYGIVVGAFSGAEQWWAAPLKISVGLLLSALICLPSLYIFSCLGGSQARLMEVFGLLTGLLALMTVLLIGFAPVAWVFSQSTQSVAMMGALHLAFWFVATCFGLRFLHSGFRHFSTRSFAGLNVWILVFLMVALQMTTALRPIIGRANTFLPAATDKKFFVSHWLDCQDI